MRNAGDNPLGNRRALLFVRGTLGYGSITCFFFACQLLPIADATTFTFLGPLVVALLSPLVLKERISRATAVVIPMCIAGVLLITQPPFLFGSGARTPLPIAGVLIGLCQPFFSAGAKVCLRQALFTRRSAALQIALLTIAPMSVAPQRCMNQHP